MFTIAPASRPRVPLAEGGPKPLTIELLQKAGELQGSVQLNSSALAGPPSESAQTKLERKREILTGLRAVLESEYGRSTAALKPLLFAQRVSSEDRGHIARALGDLNQEELAALPPEAVAKTFASVAQMVNSRESDARNFANQRMVKGQRDQALASPADIQKCAYGLMNIALAEAVEDEDLSRHRLDRRDQAGPEPVFQPAFRAECMAKFRAAMDTAMKKALAERQGQMTPAQINAVVQQVIRQIKKDNPPPPKLPSMEAWEDAHERMEAKHRASVATAWGAAPTAASTTSSASPSTSTSSTASAAGTPASESHVSEAQKARRQKLGLDFD